MRWRTINTLNKSNLKQKQLKCLKDFGHKEMKVSAESMQFNSFLN